MSATNRTQRTNLTFDQFDAVILFQDTKRNHLLIFVSAELMLRRLRHLKNRGHRITSPDCAHAWTAHVV